MIIGSSNDGTKCNPRSTARRLANSVRSGIVVPHRINSAPNPSILVALIGVTVGMIVGQIGAGHSVDDILADYPYLEREDVMQALRYAAWLAEERELILTGA